MPTVPHAPVARGGSLSRVACPSLSPASACSGFRGVTPWEGSACPSRPTWPLQFPQVHRRQTVHPTEPRKPVRQKTDPELALCAPLARGPSDRRCPQAVCWPQRTCPPPCTQRWLVNGHRAKKLSGGCAPSEGGGALSPKVIGRPESSEHLGLAAGVGCVRWAACVDAEVVVSCRRTCEGPSAAGEGALPATAVCLGPASRVQRLGPVVLGRALFRGGGRVSLRPVWPHGRRGSSLGSPPARLPLLLQLHSWGAPRSLSPLASLVLARGLVS